MEKVEGPVLSLYLDVNPARPENARRAWIIRAKNAAREAGAPKEVERRVVESLELGQPLPQGLTLVVFASEEEGAVWEMVYLKTELPVMAAYQGVIAGWGRPLLTPLLLILEEARPCAVVYLDQTHWRYLEIALGEIEEKEQALLRLDPAQWHMVRESSPGVGHAQHGGSQRDRFDRRVEDWVHRFYKDAAGRLSELLQGSRARHILLIGEAQHLSDFERFLPEHVREMITCRLPPPPEDGITPHRILEHAQPALQQAELSSKQRLLDRIRENGIWGLDSVLQALQQGRLHLLALPFSAGELNRTLHRCRGSGLLTSSADRARELSPGDDTELVRVGQVLPELAGKHGTRLEFLREEPEQRLLREFGSFAALTRW
jgi:hypothetical protein